MQKKRLDQELVRRALVETRSQAESYIKLGTVKVNEAVVAKPGYLVSAQDSVSISSERYASRAGLKLASVAALLKLNFQDKVVLDVGSSTGGFTDYALQHGAKKVIAVDVGTDQMVTSLRSDPRVELHEKTDIRSVCLRQTEQRATSNEQQTTIDTPDIILIDVSFISLREVLPHCSKLIAQSSLVVAMAKPQFEAGAEAKHRGVIKNDKMRRNTLKELENWIKNLFIIVDKADSGVAGAKGNQERFYLLSLLQKRT